MLAASVKAAHQISNLFAVPAALIFNIPGGQAEGDSMANPRFERLPADCICNGMCMAAVRDYPAVGIMPPLRAYRCPECGHVEIVETDAPGEPKAA